LAKLEASQLYPIERPSEEVDFQEITLKFDANPSGRGSNVVRQVLTMGVTITKATHVNLMINSLKFSFGAVCIAALACGCQSSQFPEERSGSAAPTTPITQTAYVAPAPPNEPVAPASPTVVGNPWDCGQYPANYPSLVRTWTRVNLNDPETIKDLTVLPPKQSLLSAGSVDSIPYLSLHSLPESAQIYCYRVDFCCVSKNEYGAYGPAVGHTIYVRNGEYVDWK
jgi:hypothetical protein